MKSCSVPSLTRRELIELVVFFFLLSKKEKFKNNHKNNEKQKSFEKYLRI